ncbi:hypothetical protein ACPDG4_15385, partial [Myroides sp. C20-1]
ENSEFITKLGDNVEFIENIVNKLKGKYGNVGYDTTTNMFFYYDEDYNPVTISWDLLGNTKIKSFEIDEVKDALVLIDTEDNTFEVKIDDLGKIIANNDVFVTKLAENNEFITHLGNNTEFQTIIKNNSATASVKLTDALVNIDNVKGGFEFNNGKNTDVVHFSETLTELQKAKNATTNLTEYYFIDETKNRDSVVIEVSQDVINDFELILNDPDVIALLKQFISNTSGDVIVERNTLGDIVITANGNTFNITEEIKDKETNTTLTSLGEGVYVYKNEEAIKTGGAGSQIDVIEDVINNFDTIVEDTTVKNILNEFVNNAVVVNYSYNEVIKPEKWLNTDKKVAVRMFDISINERTNTIEVNGDFAEVILQARLINKASNSITEGVIRKTVVNGNTQLILGIPGAVTTVHPIGTYYLILEYVKK